jgi:circadian clock protein KaiB
MTAQESQTTNGLTLFVTGTAPRSERARANLARALAALGYPADACQETDLLAQPESIFDWGILATPALAFARPPHAPEILYGDLSDEARLNAFLARLLA